MKTKRMQNSKVGTGLTFTLSTPVVDRYGDRVMPSWNLDDFRKNPIALFSHMHDAIIGTWENIRMEGSNLVADLKLAKKGTSSLVDEVTSLIQQNILKATSIGFSSADVKENDFGGYDLFDNFLLEVSVVAVPANQEALRKSLSGKLSSAEIERICTVDGCSLSNSVEGSSVGVKANKSKSKIIKTTKGFSMKFGERIAALQKAVGEKMIELEALNEKADLTDEEMETMATLTSEVANMNSRIKKFEEMEKNASGLSVVQKQSQKEPKEPTFDKDTAKGGVIKGLVAMAKASVEQTPVESILDKDFAKEKSVVSTFVKAATDPALTGTPAWAGDLVQDGYGAYLEDLIADTIFGKIPSQTVTFGKYGSISMPYRDGDGNLSGSFIEEGAPIPVKADAYKTVKISPFKMGVISVFSKEIFRKSIPNIAGLVNEHIKQDTAELIDREFLSATAATALRPAGIESVGTSTASAGATVADVLTDFNGVFERLADERLGGGGVVVIHPNRLRGLKLKTDALGNFVFKNLDILPGYNFITSINVPTDKVYVIDNKALVKGIGTGMEFEANSSATIVMGDPAEPVSDGTNVAALPIRSLYQTDSLAIRMVMEISWLAVRPKGIQILTGVAY